MGTYRRRNTSCWRSEELAVMVNKMAPRIIVTMLTI